MAVTGPASGPATGPDGPIAPLGCGRDAALVWDRAEAGLPPDEHERDCPHCSAAFAEADRLLPRVRRTRLHWALRARALGCPITLEAGRPVADGAVPEVLPGGGAGDG